MNKKIFAFVAVSTVCFAGDCECLGPSNIIANAPAKPTTCGGDIIVTASALYWNARLEGMDFAVNNGVNVPVINPTQSEIEQLNNLNDAKYVTRGSSFDFGYKFGIGYNSPCDGWSLSFEWTHVQPFAMTSVEAGVDDNQTLITLWSAFAAAQGSITFGRFIEANWKLNLDLVDFMLGREFWVSSRLSMQPYVGLRVASLKQDYHLEQMGGSWSPRVGPDQYPFTNMVHLDNDFRGVGLLSGLSCNWHIGRGFGLFGRGAGSIVYGSFDVKHDEENRLGITPHSKNTILETKEHFRASRAILDFAFGVEYSARFADANYGVNARLGWEEHLFFHQNQMWRINRVGNVAGVVDDPSGENVFIQRSGDLDTNGLTFTLLVEF